jgi:hypothetical protein
MPISEKSLNGQKIKKNSLVFEERKLILGSAALCVNVLADISQSDEDRNPIRRRYDN